MAHGRLLTWPPNHGVGKTCTQVSPRSHGRTLLLPPKVTGGPTERALQTNSPGTGTVTAVWTTTSPLYIFTPRVARFRCDEYTPSDCVLAVPRVACFLGDTWTSRSSFLISLNKHLSAESPSFTGENSHSKATGTDYCKYWANHFSPIIYPSSMHSCTHLVLQPTFIFKNQN